jgi:ribosomal-protein-alanine N-acetyltransferase
MHIAEIEFCGPEDLEELCFIESRCFDQPWNRRVIEHDLANLGAVVYLKAILRDVIAGYGVIGRNESVAHLLNLAVLQEFRGVGIASQLMLAFGEIASEWNCRRMRLEVRSSNTIARDFYSKLGFSYVTRCRSYYANGEDALILVARLPLLVK